MKTARNYVFASVLMTSCLVGVSVVGCSAEEPSSGEDLSPDVAMPEAHVGEDGRSISVMQASPRPSTVDRQAAMEKFTRAIALGLADERARHALLGAMDASPVKEGKLHLESYLRGPEPSLRDAVGRAAGLSERGIATVLALTGPLEIYMPVEAHRQRWQGDGKVIVAAQLDEGAVPVGVDLDGRRVKLSLTVAPEIPTIAIVPAESFDDDGQPLAPRSGSESDLLDPSTGTVRAEEQPDARRPSARREVSLPPSSLVSKRLVVGLVEIFNDHEPWSKGDPEIYARCRFPASGAPTLVLDLPGVNREHAVYTINQTLGTYSDSYGIPATCGLFEDDNRDDDSLGTKQIWFDSPYGTHNIPDGWFSFQP